MKKKIQVSISQFLAMIPVQVASDFIMEFNSRKSPTGNKMPLEEFFEDDIRCPHEFVLQAFSWDGTIKGIAYWNGICHKLKKQYGGGVTFPEFIEMLEPLEKHRFNNAIEKQRGEELLNEMYNDHTFCIDANEWLEGTFNWEDTEEGGEYWARICRRLEMTSHFNEPSMLN
jgi:uncharacterized protein (DUF2249 family)